MRLTAAFLLCALLQVLPAAPARGQDLIPSIAPKAYHWTLPGEVLLLPFRGLR